MRHDHRPYPLKRLQAAFETLWVNHFIAPQLEAMGAGGMIMKPWHLKLYGAGISFGEAVHVITARDRTVRLTTWVHDEGSGSITIEDYALLCPGVRIDAATSVSIGKSTMLAAGVYITDADWHGIYDRSRPIGKTSAVRLGENVWVGDGAIVCKGVSIGENTIVGAGAVVTRSLPANVIAAGNPAQVVRHLDTAKTHVRREHLLHDYPVLNRDIDLLDRALRRDNGWLKWLRSVLAPSSKD